MKLITGLFRAVRKSLSTNDSDMGMFRDKLNELVAGKDTMSDDEINAKVDEIVAITEDLPESEGKSELMRYLEDFKAVKEQEGPVAEKAAAAVADLFEKLDAEAMKDAPAEEPAGDEPAAEETSVEAVAEETEAPAEEKKDEETGDADPNPTYTLEEIWEFIKKRMQEDAACEETQDEETEEKIEVEETKDEDQEETTTDCAPRVNLTFNENARKGSLADLFNKAKNGGF